MSHGVAQARGQGAVKVGIARLSQAARFLATDRFGLLVLVWAVIAFAVRPMLLAAHHGAGGAPFENIRAALAPVQLAHVAAVFQWVSFTGAIALAVIAHVRFAGNAKSSAAAFWITAGYGVLLTTAYVAFLWSPNSVFTLIAHDSFIFFDSTYRIAHGQTPSVDFPTALGAASMYLPAWGAALSGGYAGSVELASAFVALGLCLACAQAGATRFPAAITATLVGVVFLIAVPAALLEHWGSESQTFVNGEPEILADNLSYAMFYNRWGWAALVPIFMVFAPRRDAEKQPLAEIAGFACVLAFLFYLKLSYFVVGAGAAAIYAMLNPKPVRTLLWGGGATLGLVLAVGLMTGNLIAYVQDMIAAGQVSGARTESLLGLIRKNLRDMLFAAAPLIVLAATGRFTWKDLLAAGFMMLACLFVINQNGQLENMCALIALAAYGVARVLSDDKSDRMARFAAIGAFGMLAATAVLDRGMVMIDQAYAVLREETRPPSRWAGEPALKGVYIPERESMLGRVVNTADPQARLLDFSLAIQLGRRQNLRQGEYMVTLQAGIDDLRTAMRPGDSIATLDMTNPFPFLMNARAPRGAWLTFDKNRTVSAKVHPSPETLFADTDHVMIPKMSPVAWTPELMMQLYAPWLTANYEERIESQYWVRWSHRKDHAKVATHAAGPASQKPLNTGL